MVQLQVILGEAVVFLALYTMHCTFQSSAQGSKNLDFPKVSEENGIIAVLGCSSWNEDVFEKVA